MLITDAKITGGFWKKRQDLIETKTIWEQLEILKGKKDGLLPEEYSYVIDNFKIAAGELIAEYRGYVYSDSELGKWIEAAAYSLKHSRDKKLEREIDNLVDLVCRAQLPDGYINTYFQVLRPESRLKHFAFSCELYNMGHLMEAAVAYYNITGKDKFLQAMCRTADLLCSIIGPEPEKKHVYDGHAEIELGLLSLYGVTHKENYKNLALYFVNERGKQPCFFLTEELLGDNDTGANDNWFGPDHHQAHKPVREQRKADGHAVKVTYLYSAVTELVNLGADPDGSLRLADESVWENMCRHRMYISGAIGSQGYAERFTVDDDLPSDRSYAETCASVGLCFWGKRMLRLDHSSEIADVMERALYNGLLAGWSLDGSSYFYVNMLHCKHSVTDYREDEKHVITHRSKWFKCACCPSNLLRIIENVEEYLFSTSNNTLFLDGYADAELQISHNNIDTSVSISTLYPYSGDITIRIKTKNPAVFSLALRIPGWCKKYSLDLNNKTAKNFTKINGYIILNKEWTDRDTISLKLDMPANYIAADPAFWELSGKAALARGPIVYCIENDYNQNISGIVYHSDSSFTPVKGNGLLSDEMLLNGNVLLADGKNQAYGEFVKPNKEYKITAKPYFAWCNSGETDMDVFFPII